MLENVDKAVRLFSLNKNYPNKIIIGIDSFNELKTEMKNRLALGLKVNLKGEYVSLFGMNIEIDNVNKNRLEIGYMQSLSES